MLQSVSFSFEEDYLMSKTFLAILLLAAVVVPQTRIGPGVSAQGDANVVVDLKTYQDLRWRSVGPHRGGRSTAAAGSLRITIETFR